jgi:MoxR-like ATPase
MKREKACKFCGQSGFTWAGRPGDWYLTKDGERHVCTGFNPNDEKHEPENDEGVKGLEGLTKPELVRAAHDKFGASAAKWLMQPGITNDKIRQAIESGQEPDTSPGDDEQKGGGMPQGANDNLAKVIAEAVKPHLDAKADIQEVRDIATEEVKKALDKAREPKIIVLEEPKTGEQKNLGKQHKQFEQLLKLARMGAHTYLVGPAGSGKTMAAEMVAQGLARKFYPMSMGKMTSESQLWGYNHAGGGYVPGWLREPFEMGGLALLDEVDNSNDNVITKMNAMLSNGYALFPDKLIQRHPDFVLLAAGNTYGRGADALYIGRQQLDAATLDRFHFLVWDYDEDFERTLVLDQWPNMGEWVDYVQKVRKAVAETKVRHVVSPRASIQGAKLLSNDFKRPVVEEMVLWRGLGKDDKAKVKANVR